MDGVKLVFEEPANCVPPPDEKENSIRCFLSEIPLNTKAAYLLWGADTENRDLKPSNSLRKPQQLNSSLLSTEVATSLFPTSVTNRMLITQHSVSNAESSFSETYNDKYSRSSSDPNPSTLTNNASRIEVRQLRNIPTSLMLKGRVMLVSSGSCWPSLVYSVLSKQRHCDNSSRKSHGTNQIPAIDLPSEISVESSLSALQKTKECSYEHLLQPTSRKQELVDLDHAEWSTGKHRTVLKFAGYEISIIDYIRPAELKRNLNNCFRERFPKVDITLSKIRSLESEMCEVAKLFNLESGVLQQAKRGFERLVFTSYVNKSNRHQVAATTFLVSAKVHGDLMSSTIVLLIEALEREFGTNKEDLLKEEFSCFAALEFSLLS